MADHSPESPNKKLEAHLFVCTNARENGECCAKKGAVELRDKLKKLCKEESRGWKGRVRINASGCLGHCDEGITAVLYPQGKWMTHLTKDSVNDVLKVLAEVLD